MYKDYESEVLENVRTRVESRLKRVFQPFDMENELERVTFSRPVKCPQGHGYLLEIDGRAVGYTEGAMGEEVDSVYAYQLIAFPGVNVNYEFIAYGYNRDKFFLFRNTKLIGYLKGDFKTSLDAVDSWDFMLNDWLIGTVKVNSAMLKEKRVALRFTDGREPVFFRMTPPPLYNDFASAISYCVSTYLAFNRPPSNDRVFSEMPAFDSALEQELVFCSFVFFRSLVFC